MRATLMRAAPVAFVLLGSIALASATRTRTLIRDDAIGEWRHYGADLASTKYSPLDQITPSNFKRLQLVWRWPSPDAFPTVSTPVGQLTASTDQVVGWLAERFPERWHADDPPILANFKATPIMVRGTLFLNTPLSFAAAIDAASGRTKWIFDPRSYEDGHTTMHYARWNQRGVAYWSDGDDERVLWGTGNGYLFAADARTGRPVEGFGLGGRVDLTEGIPRARRGDRDWQNALLYSVQSPPLVIGDIVVPPMSISSYTNRKEGPPGWVRAFDVRTGRLRWVFRTIPNAGEFGSETWADDSWKTAGKVGPWAPMSADPELGYVYVPVATALPDHYGGHRPGRNLFADSLLCLDADTGRRVWHFQMVHHGLWDYDPPAAPNLLDVVVNGRTVKAVAQVTKQGFVFAFDRVTGQPLWPIEERPVPPSDVPGETAWPTQPVPTRPAPFEKQGFTLDDLADATADIRREAVAAVKGFVLGPLYTPPSLAGTLQRPGIDGGANWSGAAVDPQTGILYVPSRSSFSVIQLRRPTPDDGDASLDFLHRPGARTPRLRAGLPLLRPPHARVTAIDMNTGDHRWMVPLPGSVRSGPLLTKTMMVLPLPSGGARDGPRLVAFDKRSGRELAWTALPARAIGTPMTYMVGGRQYIALTVHGDPPELVAFALTR